MARPPDGPIPSPPEFPKKDWVWVTKSKQSDKVKIGSNFFVRNKENYSLGKLYSKDPSILEQFLNKFARTKWGEYPWRIEYGILVRAYEIFKENPQELENIIKVAKTKKDLKIHLGVS